MSDRFGPALVRYVQGYLRGDLDAAHDVVQETFLTAWLRRDRIRDGQHLRPWLYRVARYKAISWIRRSGPRNASLRALCDESGPGPAQSPVGPRTAPGDDDPLLDALARALERLPPHYLGAVRLHYLHGHDSAETARLLGLPVTTVKMRLHRARAALRRLLHEAARLTQDPRLPRLERLLARRPRRRRPRARPGPG